jgi:hypothetical protein
VLYRAARLVRRSGAVSLGGRRVLTPRLQALVDRLT